MFKKLRRTLVFSIWGRFSNRGKGLYIHLYRSYVDIFGPKLAFFDGLLILYNPDSRAI